MVRVIELLIQRGHAYVVGDRAASGRVVYFDVRSFPNYGKLSGNTLDSLREAGLMTAEWQAMEGKIFDNLSQTGAVGCAAVPLFLDHGWRTGLVKEGDRVLMIGVEATPPRTAATSAGASSRSRGI